MLRILTYNAGFLKVKLFGRTLVEPAPYVNERFLCLAPALLSSGADIIALQEVYDRDQQAQLVKDIASAYPHHAVSPTRPFRPLGAALMLFSKFPLMNIKYILFKSLPLDERIFVDKGMIVATVDANAFGPMRIVNTHCTSGGALHNPEGSFTSRARSRQYRQIFDTLDSDRGMMRLAIGDFNAGPEVLPENYRELLSRGYTDVWVACHGDASAPTWDPKNELNAHGPHRSTSAQRMDHIFFHDGKNGPTKVKNAQIVLSESCVKVPVGKVTISDHYALMAELEK